MEQKVNKLIKEYEEKIFSIKMDIEQSKIERKKALKRGAEFAYNVFNEAIIIKEVKLSEWNIFLLKLKEI